MRFFDNDSTSGRAAARLLWSLSVSLLGACGLCLVACGGTDGADRTNRTERPTRISPERLNSMETSCGTNSSLTAASLLERLDPPYTAPIDSSRSSTVRLDVEYDGGFRRCFPWDRAPRQGAPRLQLAVTLELQTDDGALDATVPGTISVLQGSDDVRFTGTTSADKLDEASLGRMTADRRDEPDASAEMAGRDTDLMVEGWLQTDHPGFQGAVRLRQSTSDTHFEHQTLVSWDAPPPSSSG
jgi:hypothetical protein